MRRHTHGSSEDGSNKEGGAQTLPLTVRQGKGWPSNACAAEWSLIDALVFCVCVDAACSIASLQHDNHAHKGVNQSFPRSPADIQRTL